MVKFCKLFGTFPFIQHFWRYG